MFPVTVMKHITTDKAVVVNAKYSGAMGTLMHGCSPNKDIVLCEEKI